MQPKQTQWVFEHPNYASATISDLLTQGEWHAIARTRTKCGRQISPEWPRSILYTAYKGPAMSRRCKKCQVKVEKQNDTEEKATT